MPHSAARRPRDSQLVDSRNLEEKSSEFPGIGSNRADCKAYTAAGGTFEGEMALGRSPLFLMVARL